MLEMLYMWFIGHNHKFKVKYETAIEDKNNTTIGYIIVQECEICGKIKQIKIKD